jgi:hypothetical protein
LRIDERVLGKDHPRVAGGYNNLAKLLRNQRKYDQAEPLYRRAIEINQTVLGNDHPHLATSYNNLALLLKHQGKYDGAQGGPGGSDHRMRYSSQSKKTNTHCSVWPFRGLVNLAITSRHLIRSHPRQV